MSEKSGWSKIAEVVKTLLEIVAILVAGWWAYTRFRQEEAPSLVQRADLLGNLMWYSDSRNACQAEYEVEFHNIGKVSIEVGRVRISAWTLGESNDPGPTNEIRLLEPLKMRSGLPLVEQTTDSLVGIYAPDERSKNGFTFLVSRSLEKRVLFKIDLWRKEDVEKGISDPSWSEYRWDWVCGEYPKTLTAKQSKGQTPSVKPALR